MLSLIVVVKNLSERWFGRYGLLKLTTFVFFREFLGYNSIKKRAIYYLIVLLCREFNSLFNEKKIDVVAPLVWIFDWAKIDVASLVWIIFWKNPNGNPKGLIRV